MTEVSTLPVPENFQKDLKELDSRGANIQMQLGALELQYLNQREKLIRSFEENRQLNDQTVLNAAAEAGIDVQNDRSKWELEFAQMRFRRVT